MILRYRKQLGTSAMTGMYIRSKVKFGKSNDQDVEHPRTYHCYLAVKGNKRKTLLSLFPMCITYLDISSII